MKNRKLLAIIVLSLSFCFVPRVGYGEEMTMEQLREAVVAQKASQLDLILLQSVVKYIRNNPNDFLDISCHYNPFDFTSIEGSSHKDWGLPEDFDTKDKLFITIRDSRGAFSGKADLDLLKLFIGPLHSFLNGSALLALFSYDSDIVAIFHSEEGNIPVGNFYQGVFHLWEE